MFFSRKSEKSESPKDALGQGTEIFDRFKIRA